jgi:hypothetical protein
MMILLLSVSGPTSRGKEWPSKTKAPWGGTRGRPENLELRKDSRPGATNYGNLPLKY